MTFEIMGLGWHVRFVPVAMMDVMSDFFTKTLGLPRSGKMRQADGDAEQKDYLWGGEAIIMNHNYGGEAIDVDPREADPDRARQVANYRVSDIDAVVGRLREKNASVIGPRPFPGGREAFVVDPMGILLGLRQCDPGSALPQDAEATRRRLRGEAFNPGCGPLPPDWQEIGWIRITAADFPALVAFYRDVLTIPLVESTEDRALFDIGDNTLLELAPGGVSRPAPKAQMASLAAMILRVDSVRRAAEFLRGRGVHFVHDVFSPARGDLAYIADPEGNVIGLSDRLHPGAYVDRLPVYPEDMEAQRRWVETKSRRA
jgi:predicted enzyme related to lactoylglutathione lyase